MRQVGARRCHFVLRARRARRIDGCLDDATAFADDIGRYAPTLKRRREKVPRAGRAARDKCRCRWSPLPGAEFSSASEADYRRRQLAFSAGLCRMGDLRLLGYFGHFATP